MSKLATSPKFTGTGSGHRHHLARPWWAVLRITVMVYFGFMIYLAIFQRRVMYYPAKAMEGDLLARAARSGLHPWRNSEGVIIGWRTGKTGNATRPADRMLVFHGNAGFALDRLYLTTGFTAPGLVPRMEVILLEYPGYGARPGSPSESAFLAAATEALEQLEQESPDGRIFLAGESLGSGVAARLAAAHPHRINGLFLISAFSSMVDVARHHYPYMPVRWLLRDRYDSALALRDYRGPVAIMLADPDEVVPTRFGIRLHDGYNGPKRLWVQENRGHNMLDYSLRQTWWQEVLSFIAPSPDIQLP